MDKPTNPGGPNDTSWPEDSGSGQGFGATGVFRAADSTAEPGSTTESDPIAKLLGAKPEFAAGPGVAAPVRPQSDPFNPPSFIGSRAVMQPTVHKVVLGGGAENSPELLDRIRMASQEKTPIAEKPAPAPAPASGGFTQLLRTLEFEVPSAATAPKSAPAPQAQPAAKDSGFTSLLRAMGTEESTAQTEAPKIGQPPSAPVSSPAPSAGGFTEMLRTAPTDADPMMTYPLGARRPVVPPPPEKTPGSFTQLFEGLGASQASTPSEKADSSGGSAGSFTRMLSMEPQSAPPPSEKVDTSAGSAGSFTRMLSLEPPAAPAELPRFDQNKPVIERMNFAVVPEPERPSAPSGDPFSAQPFPESTPPPAPPQSGSVGITRLIRMLDEPSNAPPPPPREAPPASPATGAGAGVWTQTFASLSTPNDPPAAATPAWAPAASSYPAPPAPPPTPAIPPPVISAPAAPSGPSEFTRILDASRIREMGLKGGQAAESAIPAAPVSPAAPMPSYQPPAPPPMGMPMGGAMPHPAAYPPPVPQAPGMYAPVPHAPQTPAMHMQTPPLPSAPPSPPAKPAAPAGGLQQMVPILLIVVIVLLVVLIVTVFFMMKH